MRRETSTVVAVGRRGQQRPARQPRPVAQRVTSPAARSPGRHGRPQPGPRRRRPRPGRTTPRGQAGSPVRRRCGRPPGAAPCTCWFLTIRSAASRPDGARCGTCRAARPAWRRSSRAPLTRSRPGAAGSSSCPITTWWWHQPSRHPQARTFTSGRCAPRGRAGSPSRGLTAAAGLANAPGRPAGAGCAAHPGARPVVAAARRPAVGRAELLRWRPHRGTADTGVTGSARCRPGLTGGSDNDRTAAAS